MLTDPLKFDLFWQALLPDHYHYLLDWKKRFYKPCGMSQHLCPQADEFPGWGGTISPDLSPKTKLNVSSNTRITNGTNAFSPDKWLTINYENCVNQLIVSALNKKNSAFLLFLAKQKKSSISFMASYAAACMKNGRMIDNMQRFRHASENKGRSVTFPQRTDRTHTHYCRPACCECIVLFLKKVQWFPETAWHSR